MVERLHAGGCGRHDAGRCDRSARHVMARRLDRGGRWICVDASGAAMARPAEPRARSGASAPPSRLVGDGAGLEQRRTTGDCALLRRLLLLLVHDRAPPASSSTACPMCSALVGRALFCLDRRRACRTVRRRPRARRPPPARRRGDGLAHASVECRRAARSAGHGSPGVDRWLARRQLAHVRLAGNRGAVGSLPAMARKA